MTKTVVLILLVLAGTAACHARRERQAASPMSSAPTSEVPRVLVFSKTAGFRHDSIPAGIEAIRELGVAHGFAVEATENPAVFGEGELAEFSAIVFLNTTGDVLTGEQQRAMEQFMRRGNGFVGIHAAADTEPEWDWYGHLVGARFASHPAVQPAVIRVSSAEHPSTAHLPAKWSRTDEWYNFDAHPRQRLGNRVQVLATLDESSYSGGSMGGDHPFAWCHEPESGRAWYTAGGHTIESFSEPEFLQHLLGGIQWAARLNRKGAG
jgi:type 1 glutamine amidotransferase